MNPERARILSHEIDRALCWYRCENRQPKHPKKMSTEKNPYDYKLYRYERLEKDEGKLLEKLIPVIKDIIKKSFLGGTTPRDAHGKGLAIAKGEFIVEPDLPDELRVGLFKEPRTYETWVRFSNLNYNKDITKNVRAMALKLVDVPGKKLWQEPKDATTLDLITMGVPRFLTPNVKQFFDLEVADLKGGIHLLWYLFTHPTVAFTLFRSLQRCANVLEVPYWSTTAYLFGPDNAVKFHIRPHKEKESVIPKKPGPNFLRRRLIRDLSAQGTAFDFMVQFQTDPDSMPIENPNKLWSTKKSPFIKVATIKIPRQVIDSPAQMVFAENISYNPWRTLAEHRPLGSVNRVRKEVYQTISNFRHYRNDVVRQEPGAGLEFPQSEPNSDIKDAPEPPPRNQLFFSSLKRAAVFALFLAASYFAYRFFFPDLPKSVQVYDIKYLNDQAWTDSVKQSYYHTDQGSRLMPYQWYVNMEQLGNRKMFNDPDNYSRFRLFPDPNPLNNQYRLPVGFAITDPDPVDNTRYVGISCATCHTGQLNYKGIGLRIDGGSGMVNFNAFLAEMIKSLVETRYSPRVFNRFAKRVHGENVSRAQKRQLRKAIDAYLKQQFANQYNEKSETFKQAGVNTFQGFGRIDALGAGGNALYANFGKQNLRPLDAPVGIPVLWYTHQYDWVQLNSSIRQPMSRNIIEALAVNARVTVPGYPDWTNQKDELFLSNIEMEKMFKLENAVSKLKAPEWPEEILGTIDLDLAATGKKLYTENCASCHAKQYETTWDYWQKVKADMDPRKYEKAFNKWKENDWDTVSQKYGGRYFKLRLFPVKQIGTDPTDAVNFAERRLDATTLIEALDQFDMNAGNISMDEAENILGAKIIPLVIDGTMARKYDTLRSQWKKADPTITRDSLDAKQALWNGNRESMWQAQKIYAARPLSGIWTSAPYLHNNSVPNLYELLSPVKDRTKKFYTGNLEFDPENVGYEHEYFKGGTLIDTGKKGNSNAGHEFTGQGDVKAPGVIGRYLEPEERYAIIEYLKQLKFEDEGYELYFPDSTYSQQLRKGYYDKGGD